MELLTVMALIGLLAALLLPRFWRAHDRAEYTACGQNLQNLATALEQYAADNAGATSKYPTSLSALVPKYLMVLPSCPSAAGQGVTDTYTSTYSLTSDGNGFSIYCKGSYHVTAGQNPNEPWFDSSEGLGPR